MGGSYRGSYYYITLLWGTDGATEADCYVQLPPPSRLDPEDCFNMFGGKFDEVVDAKTNCKNNLGKGAKKRGKN